MALPTVPVTCKAFDQLGQPIPGAIFTAQLNRTDRQDGFIVPTLISGTAGQDGICLLNLWPNALGSTGSAYKITGTNPTTKRRFLSGNAVIPNAACDLDDVIGLPTYPVTWAGSGGAGAKGDKGDAGTPGAAWRNGNSAPANTVGADGDYFLDRSTGDVYFKTAGVYDVISNLKGPAGIGSGSPGSVWRNGTADPSNGVGVDGDYFLNRVSGDVFFKSGGVYALSSNIKGPAGTGTAGANGATWRDGNGVPANGLGANGDFYLDKATGDVYTKVSGAYAVSTNLKGPAGTGGGSGGNTATVDLPYASTLTINASLSEVFRVALTGNITIANPTNLTDGKRLGLIVKQGAGGYTATFDSAFKFAGGTPPELSTAVNAVDYMEFRNTPDGLLLLNIWKNYTSTPTAPVPAGFMAKVGANMSGMEWSAPSLRYGSSTTPNLNFTVPRAPDVQYMANQGFGKIRLPIQWELLQPVLASSNPNTATRAIVGQPGAFNAAYQSYITSVLDACAAAGVKCLLDLHNYCRYQDFVYESDGSILGLVNPSDPLIQPYTTNNSKVRIRLMALAAGATLTQADFNDFWVRAANLWKNHPGFGGYGLMNEPRQMPKAGGIVPYDSPFTQGNVQDYSIWTTFAISAYNAIRAVDPTGLIYVGGNDWQNVMSFATINPGFPIPGATNVIYDAHMYLDASSGGFRFDWDYEVSLGYSAGIQGGVVNEQTGRDRLQLGVNWCNSFNPPLKLALTEIGMPIDDQRWQNSFQNALTLAKTNDVEIYTWMGGNHWPIHGYPINHVPQWHQNKTFEPLVGGALKQAGLVNLFALFADGDSYALGGAPGTITVYARGNLTAPVTVNVARTGGGTLSKSVLTIPAGANGKDTFTYTPAANEIATITFSGPAQVPPARKFYSLADPVAYASTSLADAGNALMAKYKVSKWLASDAYTDYMQGVPSTVNAVARAIADSGYGSTVGNPMEMLCWHNDGQGQLGYRSVPKVQEADNIRYLNLTAYGTLGLWCKKRVVVANDEPNPTNKPLFNIEDPHFAIATLRVASAGLNGVAFQAGQAEELHYAELSLNAGVPQAKWQDSGGQVVTRAGTALTLNAVHTLSMQAAAGGGAKALRVNGAVANSANATLAASRFNQMLMGWGYVSYFPRDGFQGHLFGVAAGKGSPTSAEMQVMEGYLAVLAGSSIALPTSTPTPLNNMVALVGDSRTSVTTVNTNIVEPQDKTVYGYASWVEAACGYRAKVVGNYGINANTLDDMIRRLSGVETRGQILNSPASVYVLLGGVNNTTEAIGTVGPKYQSLINQLTAAGKICIVFNEVPNNDSNTQGAVNLGRRTYLDSAVYTNDNRVIRFNSYDLMAQNSSSFMSKTGYYGDALHPGLKGHRELGLALGALFNQLFANFPVRNALATVKGALAPMFNGTSGSLGAGATGVMATDWNGEAIPAGLTVAYSKGSDSDGYEQLIITVSGTPTGAAFSFAQWHLDNYATAVSNFASNDAVEHGIRCIIDAGSTGLVGVEPKFSANDNTNSVFLRASSFTTNIFDNSGANTAPWLAGDMKGEAFDYVIKSPPVTMGAGWTASASKSVNPRVGITFRRGAAVNAVIRLSRSTLHKNV